MLDFTRLILILSFAWQVQVEEVVVQIPWWTPVALLRSTLRKAMGVVGQALVLKFKERPHTPLDDRLTLAHYNNGVGMTDPWVLVAEVSPLGLGLHDFVAGLRAEYSTEEQPHHVEVVLPRGCSACQDGVRTLFGWPYPCPVAECCEGTATRLPPLYDLSLSTLVGCSSKDSDLTINIYFSSSQTARQSYQRPNYALFGDPEMRSIDHGVLHLVPVSYSTMCGTVFLEAPLVPAHHRKYLLRSHSQQKHHIQNWLVEHVQRAAQILLRSPREDHAAEQRGALATPAKAIASGFFVPVDLVADQEALQMQVTVPVELLAYGTTYCLAFGLAGDSMHFLPPAPDFQLPGTFQLWFTTDVEPEEIRLGMCVLPRLSCCTW